jgi:hypothetical protein
MRYAALMVAAMALAACNTFEDDAQRTNARTGAFAFPAAFTTADARIITERKHPVTGQDVVCTEPSPDVAKAISTAFALSGQGSNTPPAGASGTPSPGTVTASGGTSMGSAEAVAELAGRSTALLGLRDGLFQACQAYANGVIGADIYALIVSRYGQLMTTLFLGQDIAGIPQSTAVAQSPSISATATTAPGSGGGSPNAAVNVPAGTPPGSLAGAVPAPAAGAANALTRMNEDYLNLDYNTIHSLAIVCINRSDRTNLAGNEKQLSPWMDEVCKSLMVQLTPAALSQLETLAVGLVKGQVLAPPVNPTAAPPPTK